MCTSLVYPAAPTSLLNPEWEAQRRSLAAPDEVLFDVRSRPEFGDLAALFRSGPVQTEIADRRVSIRGLFEMGASFSADGTAITTDEGFARLFPQRNSQLVDLGLIHLRSSADCTGGAGEVAGGPAARCGGDDP